MPEKSGDVSGVVRATRDFADTVQLIDGEDQALFLRSVIWVLAGKVGPSVLVSNFEAEELASYFNQQTQKTCLHLLVPTMQVETKNLAQVIVPVQARQSWEPPVGIKVFAGYVYGGQAFIRDVRSFLGICERLPASPAWQELYQRPSVMDCDGFVTPEFRPEVSTRLGVQLKSAFTASPVAALQRLYTARHLNDGLLQASPVGHIIGSVDSDVSGRPRVRSVARGSAACAALTVVKSGPHQSQPELEISHRPPLPKQRQPSQEEKKGSMRARLWGRT